MYRNAGQNETLSNFKEYYFSMSQHLILKLVQLKGCPLRIGTPCFEVTTITLSKVQDVFYRRLDCLIFPTIRGEMKHPKVSSFWSQKKSFEQESNKKTQ